MSAVSLKEIEEAIKRVNKINEKKIKIICKKDWYLDGKLGYKAGKYYKVLKMDKAKFANGILLKADQEIKYFKEWFWSGSDYFDVDELFN